jgi:hypothetical protein
LPAAGVAVVEDDHGASVAAAEEAGMADGNAAGAGGVMTLTAGGNEAPAGSVKPGVGRDDADPKGATAGADDAGVTETGSVPPPIAITPPHTEHLARTPVAGTLAGSTRKTDLQSGHETVMTRPRCC